MTDCRLCDLRHPTLDELVYKRLLKLSEEFEENLIESAPLIPSKEVRQRVCPVLCLTRKQLRSILHNLSRLGLIEVIPKHGIRVRRVEDV